MSRRTEKQSEASRRNGARSGGPVTPEGRKKSSLNALIHGLTSHQKVLRHEDREERTAHTEAYMERFQPRDKVEIDLVKQISDAAWDMERMANIEASVLTLHTMKNKRYADEQFKNLSEAEYVAYAFRVLADGSTSLPLLLRYRASARRTYQRALDTLESLRRLPDAPAQNRGRHGAAPDTLPPTGSPPADQTRTGPESPAAVRQPRSQPSVALRGSPRPAQSVKVPRCRLPLAEHRDRLQSFSKFGFHNPDR